MKATVNWVGLPMIFSSWMTFVSASPIGAILIAGLPFRDAVIAGGIAYILSVAVMRLAHLAAVVTD